MRSACHIAVVRPRVEEGGIFVEILQLLGLTRRKLRPEMDQLAAYELTAKCEVSIRSTRMAPRRAS